MNRNIRLVVLALVLADFLALTGWAVLQDGYVAIFRVGLESWAGAQVFADLTVALGMVGVWIYVDARQRGRSPWPWIIATPFVGSIAPLAYLLLREATAAEQDERIAAVS